MSFSTTADKAVPHLDVNKDTGNFVYAVSQRPPGGQYMAEGTTCSWSEFVKVWSEVTGQKGVYKQVTGEQLAAAAPDPEFGREVADMFDYSSDPGYDGGMKLLTAEDIRKVRATSGFAQHELTNSSGRHRLSHDQPKGFHDQGRLDRCPYTVRGSRTP